MCEMSHQEGLGNKARTRIRNVRGTQVQSLIRKLDLLWPHLPTSLPLQELLSPADYTSGEASGGKHVMQEASILGHLRRIQALVDPPVVAIELGAGTGRLSERLQRVTDAQFTHVLVYRCDFQLNQTRDGAMRTRARQRNRPEDAVQRETRDIATLDLSKYCCGPPVLCMSKHLCGPACDLSIAALGRLRPSMRPPCAVATCCHYLCTWDSFVGQDCWLRLGLSSDEFQVAVAVSQWASLNSNKKRKCQENATDTREDDDSESFVLPDLGKATDEAFHALSSETSPVSPRMSSEEFERSFSRDEKVALGTRIKILLDLCRAAKMQEYGFEVRLLRYTTRSTEDRLLVATRV